MSYYCELILWFSLRDLILCSTSTVRIESHRYFCGLLGCERLICHFIYRLLSNLVRKLDSIDTVSSGVWVGSTATLNLHYHRVLALQWTMLALFESIHIMFWSTFGNTLQLFIFDFHVRAPFQNWSSHVSSKQSLDFFLPFSIFI